MNNDDVRPWIPCHIFGPRALGLSIKFTSSRDLGNLSAPGLCEGLWYSLPGCSAMCRGHVQCRQQLQSHAPTRFQHSQVIILQWGCCIWCSQGWGRVCLGVPGGGSEWYKPAMLCCVDGFPHKVPPISHDVEHGLPELLQRRAGGIEKQPTIPGELWGEKTYGYSKKSYLYWWKWWKFCAFTRGPGLPVIRFATEGEAWVTKKCPC